MRAKKTRIIDARDNLIYSNTGRVISLLDVRSIVVVDAEDALWMAEISRSQEVE